MRVIPWSVLVLTLVRPASSEPLAREIEELLAGSQCKETPLSMSMPNARLGRVFDTLESLSGMCLRFEVDPAVAARAATIKLQDAPLATVLDMLARTNGLAYAVEGGRVRVSAISPSTAGGDALAPREGAALHFALRGAQGAAPARPRLKIEFGECGSLALGLGESKRVYRLDVTGGGVHETDDLGTSVRLRLCPNRSSDGGLHLAGDVAVRQIVDKYGAREESRVLSRAIRAGERDVVLFKTADGGIELTLTEYELLPVAGR